MKFIINVMATLAILSVSCNENEPACITTSKNDTHMNWGWEGEYNGYYYDANFNIPDSNKGLKNREDVFIKK